MLALKFCKKHRITFINLQRNVKELYGRTNLKESDNIPWNLATEILNYTVKKKNNIIGTNFKKKKDRRTILPCIIEKDPVPPNKKRVEIPTPFGGKVRK